MNAERDVDDENDGETLGRTGNVWWTYLLCNLFKDRVSNKHHKDKPLSSRKIKSTKETKNKYGTRMKQISFSEYFVISQDRE